MKRFRPLGLTLGPTACTATTTESNNVTISKSTRRTPALRHIGEGRYKEAEVAIQGLLAEPY